MTDVDASKFVSRFVVREHTFRRTARNAIGDVFRNIQTPADFNVAMMDAEDLSDQPVHAGGPAVVIPDPNPRLLGKPRASKKPALPLTPEQIAEAAAKKAAAKSAVKELEKATATKIKESKSSKLSSGDDDCDTKDTSKETAKALKKLEKIIYNNSDAVVTIDQTFFNTILPRFRDSKKLHEIPNFVDTHLYKPLDRNKRLPSIFPVNDKMKILYAGNIGFFQDWEPMLYAAKELLLDNVEFWIVGEGVQKKFLEN